MTNYNKMNNANDLTKMLNMNGFTVTPVFNNYEKNGVIITSVSFFAEDEKTLDPRVEDVREIFSQFGEVTEDGGSLNVTVENFHFFAFTW